MKFRAWPRARQPGRKTKRRFVRATQAIFVGAGPGLGRRRVHGIFLIGGVGGLVVVIGVPASLRWRLASVKEMARASNSHRRRRGNCGSDVDAPMCFRR